MKLQLANLGSGPGNEKKNIIVIVVLVAVILTALFFAYRVIFSPESESGAFVPEMSPGQSPGGGPPLSADGAASTPPASPSPAPPPAPVSPSQPMTTSPPSATPGAPAPSSASTSEKSAVTEQSGMNAIKVFNAVTIVFPKNWKIVPVVANDVAVFSDGNGRFEVLAPDPRARSAEAIALSALDSVARGGAIMQQGHDKVGGFDAYWLAVKRGGHMLRIVGVDSPTRIVIVESVRKGSFDSYRDTFNKMQQAVRFGG